MTVKLVMLKSGEDIIADVKEIKSVEQEDHRILTFMTLLIVKMYEPEEPTVLNEEGSLQDQYSSKINIVQFYPWIPLSSEESRVPCSADWVITIVEPIEKFKKTLSRRN